MRDGREFTRRTLLHFSLGSLFVRHLLAESSSPAPNPVKSALQSFSTVGAVQRRQARETVDALLQRSIEAFPVTTLGL